MDDVANDGLSMGEPLVLGVGSKHRSSKLTRGAGGAVLEPDKNVPVLIYCLKDCGDIVLKE
jgi:hypothetical protein